MKNIDVIEILNRMENKTLNCKLKTYTKIFIDSVNNIDILC